MNEQDKTAFAHLLPEMFALQRRTCSRKDIEFWFRALAAYDLADISRAMTAHIRNPDTGKYPIQPADVVRHIDGSGDARALRGWSLVERAMRSIGPWQSVAFDDPCIHAVIVDMGGWSHLCETRDPDLPFVRQEFVRRYRAALIHPPALEEVPRALPGLGSATASPRLVGDPNLALAVWRSGASAPQKSFPTADEWMQKIAKPLPEPPGATIEHQAIPVAGSGAKNAPGPFRSREDS
ncbi:DUF6475 domain-containing protein [Acidiferrobacter sp.]|uniref:DUF6475 domain-containing protein n=1 Tax=Acidiferrobacter sp. TaxID=1872107 RepID=UPI00262F0A07|nr:DUF6475 domain-containing protein [Acidiferrobacter sp.]